VTQFAQAQYQKAMETFLVFNVNPALVISLFPSQTISGPLHIPRDGWMELFGAVSGAQLEPTSESSKLASDDPKSILRFPSLGLRKKESVDTLRQKQASGDDTASIASGVEGERTAPVMTGDEREFSIPFHSIFIPFYSIPSPHPF
jgi:hypothetical protein